MCGNKRCEKQEGLKSWEVNFAYVEQGDKRNALVKLSKLCVCWLNWVSYGTTMAVCSPSCLTNPLVSSNDPYRITSIMLEPIPLENPGEDLLNWIYPGHST